MKKLFTIIAISLGMATAAYSQEFSAGIAGTVSWGLDYSSKKAALDSYGANIGFHFENGLGAECSAYKGERIFIGPSYKFLENGKLSYTFALGPMYRHEKDLQNPYEDIIIYDIERKRHGMAGKLTIDYRLNKHFSIFADTLFVHDYYIISRSSYGDDKWTRLPRKESNCLSSVGIKLIL